jgi:uncharacterized membrane protein YccC
MTKYLEIRAALECLLKACERDPVNMANIPQAMQRARKALSSEAPPPPSAGGAAATIQRLDEVIDVAEKYADVPEAHAPVAFWRTLARNCRAIRQGIGGENV